MSEWCPAGPDGHRCLHEAGRAVEPREEQLAEEVRQAVLAAWADETPWKEWASCCGWAGYCRTSTVTWYLIGHRSTELRQIRSLNKSILVGS
ncbi:MAG: hypothetical protein ACRESZ_13735 [Methylococcales bacterium]